MNTAAVLRAQYDNLAVIPLAVVCRDYFTHLAPDHLARKVLRGDIKLPIVRMEDGQKCARGVHVEDLADYLDLRAALARRELEQMTRPPGAPRVAASQSVNMVEGEK